MYGMDVNRRKWRWWRSAHVQCVRGQLTFQRNGLHFKYRMFLLQGFDYEAQQRGDLDSASLQVVPEEPLNQNYTETETWGVRHTCSLTWEHICTCRRHAARRQKVMTLPLSVWAAGAIDRWPSRLFTVKAPSIALLHYVTFNRALAYWNSAPWCTFHTIHIFSLQYIRLPCSYVLITYPFSDSLVKFT